MIERAANDGWALTTVFDNGTARPYFMVAAIGAKFQNDKAALQHVIGAAKQLSTLHQHALKVVAASRIVQPQGKK